MLAAMFIAAPSASAEGIWNGTDIDTSWYNPADAEYSLKTGAQLAGLSAIVNGTAAGIDASDFADKTIKLADDINFGGNEFTPIGTSNGASKKLAGTFDGQDYTISDFKVVMPSKDGLGNRFGFFGVLSGTCKNTNFTNAIIETPFSCYSGVIAGYVEGGKIIKCTTDATSKVICVASSNGGLAGRVHVSELLIPASTAQSHLRSFLEVRQYYYRRNRRNGSKRWHSHKLH